MFTYDIAKEEYLNQLLTKLLGEKYLVAKHFDMPVYTIPVENILQVFKTLYDDEVLQFRFLTSLCGVHYPNQELSLGVVYQLHSFANNFRIRIKTFAEEAKPEIPSLTPIFEAANWLERETYDFFGIIFTGHPNLKRILNMDNFVGFPLRKGFPLEDQTREDKIDSFFGRD